MVQAVDDKASKRNVYAIVAAISGALAVLLGAFAAHGLKGSLTEYQAGIWQTAVFYQMCHSLLLLFVSGQKSIPAAVKRSLLAGILLFSGSLYLLALTGIKWLGAITPIGGIAFVTAWLLLAFHNFKKN